MQVDDGAKAAPETILNDGEDWLTIIEGSLHVIPQDHWGIGATIKVRLDGDRLVISADEPGYSESISLRIPALTTRPEPAADAVVATAVMREVISEAMNKGADISHDMNSADYKAWEPFIERYTDMALQAALAVEPWLSLDAVEWEEVHISKSDVGSGVVVEIDVPDSRYRRVVIGSGATVEAALASAVRHAKENGDG